MQQQQAYKILFLVDCAEQIKLPTTIVPYILLDCSKVLNDDMMEHYTDVLEHGHWDLILLCNGKGAFPKIIQQLVLHQHLYHGVPILFFPYANVSELTMHHLLPIHPMQFGTQVPVNNKKYRAMDRDWLICDFWHMVVHNVCTICCDSAYRSSAIAKKDTHVIATWVDGVPLIAQRHHAMVINMCLSHYQTIGTDAHKLIQQTVHYLLLKYARKALQCHLVKMRAFTNVIFWFAKNNDAQ